MDAVHHRVCPGPLTASVLEGRLIRSWAPPFNQQGKLKRTDPAIVAQDQVPGVGTSVGGVPAGPEGAVAKATRPRRRGRRPTWTAVDLEQDPIELLTPFATKVSALARAQRYEDAAKVRDEAEQLRRLLGRHRRVESLKRAGRVVLLIDGDMRRPRMHSIYDLDNSMGLTDLLQGQKASSIRRSQTTPTDMKTSGSSWPSGCGRTPTSAGSWNPKAPTACICQPTASPDWPNCAGCSPRWQSQNSDPRCTMLMKTRWPEQ